MLGSRRERRVSLGSSCTPFSSTEKLLGNSPVTGSPSWSTATYTATLLGGWTELCTCFRVTPPQAGAHNAKKRQTTSLRSSDGVGNGEGVRGIDKKESRRVSHSQ